MNKRGQSMIEYALLAVLVILGVVVMGPYVLRSVNAHFKLWDDSARDSYKENLTQAPLSDLPTNGINLNCTCTQDTSTGCGGAGSQCGANQSIWSHSCSPQGCDGALSTYCKVDPSCCAAVVPEGCGTVPLGQPATATNCNYGYQITGHQCGSNNTIQCVQDTTDCPMPSCTGVLSPGAKYCATNTTTAPTSGLTQDTPISYVATCPSNPTCQVYCSGNGFILNSSRSSCLDQFTVAAALQSCPGASHCPAGPGQCCNTGTSVTNNQSFTITAGPGDTIKSILVTDLSSPQTSPYCKSPSGNPGERCQITPDY